MIRADWTPLWVADRGNARALGRKQILCLELLRDHGPTTREELSAAGVGAATIDSLLSGWPGLLAPDGPPAAPRPQRCRLAAPGQLQELHAILAAVAAHGKTERTRWSGAAVDHLLNTGVIRSDGQQYALCEPPWHEDAVAQEIRSRSRWPQPAVPSRP